MRPALGRATRRAAIAIGALASVLASASGALAQTTTNRPLWEAGVGVGALRVPHYRGADQSHNWVLPVPYVVYRGKILRADRDGARAVLLETDRFDFDLSLAASTPTRSDDNEARRGMDDLEPTLELGPNLNWTLGRGPGWKLDLRAPVRAVFTVEASPSLLGWNATPNLNLDLDLAGWNVGLLAGPVFGTRRLHATTYDVRGDDVTDDRPAYRARGGYAGSQFTLAMSRRFERQWAGFFLRYDTLQGARFVDSPLVRQRDNWSVGVAYAWVFAQSSRTVSSDD